MSDSTPSLTAALETLRLRLLDLTRRNSLINFRHTTGKSLQFVEGSSAAIYKKLVEENTNIKILGLPEPSRSDWVARGDRQQRPEPKDWAKSKGIAIGYDISGTGKKREESNLRALMYADDLARHCRKIEREAKLAIEETGANMLFLILGFLEFPDQRDSDSMLNAPLISIPVTLQKRDTRSAIDASGIEEFSLQYTGDDISENLSLREKLRNSFGLVLPELSEEQIDVNNYFAQIESIIKNQPEGFTVRHRVSLGLLSFGNMLLVRDLDWTKWPSEGGKNALIDHPILRQVLEGDVNRTETGPNFSEDHRVEEGIGACIPLVYDADSSQHRALIDVLSLKKSLVIEGPPGTGKSQTITNLIAACLAEGKKVLFVAEKLTALEVVKNRLSMAGLDPFVLELHSNKTNKKRVLEELNKRMAFAPEYPHELPHLQQHFETHRQELKAYTDLMNSVACNALGRTVHEVMWRAEKHRQELGSEETLLSQRAIGDATQMSEPECHHRVDCLRHLANHYQSIGGFDASCTFWGFYPQSLIPGDEVKLTQLFQAADTWGQALVKAAQHLSQVLGGRVDNLSLAFCGEQLEVLARLLETPYQQLPLHLIPRFFADDQTGVKAAHEIDAFAKQIKQFHALEATVTTALIEESSVTKFRTDELRSLQQQAQSLGAELGTLDDLRSLHQQLIDLTKQLSSANTAVVRFSAEKYIPFDGSKQKLEQLLSFSNLILDTPDEYLHLQTKGLVLPGAVQRIEQLFLLQTEWRTLEKELSNSLYMDTLPQEEDIKQAILTLREGEAWYRIFQGRWRRAVGLHKALQRTKEKIPLPQRLNQLEQIAKLLRLKEQWKTSPVWATFLGLATPTTPIPLEAYVMLARWNDRIQVAAEEIETSLIDPINLTAPQARALRREFSVNQLEITAAMAAFNGIKEKLKRLSEFRGGHLIDTVMEKTATFTDALHKQFEWLALEARGQATFNEVLAGCDAAMERVTLKSQIQTNESVKARLDDLYLDVHTDCVTAMKALSFGQRINDLHLSPQVKHQLRSGHPIETSRLLIAAMKPVYHGLQEVKHLNAALSEFGKFELDAWADTSPNADLELFAQALHKAAQKAVQDKDILMPWSLYLTRRAEATALGLAEFVGLLEHKQVRPNKLGDAYAYCTYNTIIRAAFRHMPQLGQFTGLRHDKIRQEFKRLDREIIKLRGKAIAQKCTSSALPPSGRGGARVDDRTEMALLNHLMPQQRPRMPVRKILTRAGASIQALKPCFMMGPQAVAQYLTPGVIQFDVVIMDEASQLKPEEAIGSVARGGQLVVVGDPKQLPPTSFFSRMSQDNDDGDGLTTTDAESILDLCSSHFKPIRSLRWHYRSQHHSLIAFSNHHFYRGNLVIFPSPYGQGGTLGVRAVYLADAIYENQTNLREAERVVDAVVEHIATRSEDSLGIVTLNLKQRDLIADLLEERLKSVRDADAYRDHWIKEGAPLFIKNLETVQGDERDAIVISTTFGKSPGSRVVRQNFGPISRQGGWRRLNVLFTRAKKSIAIYTSLRPEDIVIDRNRNGNGDSNGNGSNALRNYLEYVRTGALPTFVETGREPDSDFEISVINMLQRRGYDVTPQLGVAGYRIDIAVKHPDWPGTYLAAIECDGASYHSALSVRDRDRIRQEILESLGWRGRIWRIWSTDWFRTPRQEMEKLIRFLESLRTSWKPEHASGSAWIEEGQSAGQAAQPSTDKTDVVTNITQAEK